MIAPGDSDLSAAGTTLRNCWCFSRSCKHTPHLFYPKRDKQEFLTLDACRDFRDPGSSPKLKVNHMCIYVFGEKFDLELSMNPVCRCPFLPKRREDRTNFPSIFHPTLRICLSAVTNLTELCQQLSCPPWTDLTPNTSLISAASRGFFLARHSCKPG